MANKEIPGLDKLTDAQRERLAKLTTEINYDRLTVSFMIEERNQQWGKRSAFYSVTANRDQGGEQTGDGTGWSQADLKVVRCLLCKHVVTATYDDAVKRRILERDRALEECRSIIGMYDAQLIKHLTNGE